MIVYRILHERYKASILYSENIKIYRDRYNWMLVFSQIKYRDWMLKGPSMKILEMGLLPSDIDNTINITNRYQLYPN